ncbi:MAG: methyltransferase domain-containing protein [Chlorobiaceae bacterium]|nr:methyltransferase domain-containing protein [Chlorobiaceae bacterium]NTW74370.1 methyltransferase domain-containing protein [Chlorobiaceae bacterium]
MLQLRTAGYQALDSMRSRGDSPPLNIGIDELETVVDGFMQRFMDERLAAAESLGPGFLMIERFDRAIRTHEREHMDETSTSGKEKLELLRALDRMNEMSLAYRHQIDLLVPVIRELSRMKSGPLRVLELAAGSGGLAFALARHARDRKIDLLVTASDIVPETVTAGNLAAETCDLPVSFRVMNAFDFEGIDRNTFDLVVMSQSLHHFTPGQLALMIRRSEEHGAAAFIGIDGHRSLLLLAGVPLVASLQGNEAFTKDGLTSARKFYSEIELDIVAGIATGRNHHRVSCSWPMTMLQVGFLAQES